MLSWWPKLGHPYALDDLKDGRAAHHKYEEGQQPGTHLGKTGIDKLFIGKISYHKKNRS